jgi:IS1 family transposase
LVICLEKSGQALSLDRPVLPDAASCGVFIGDRSQSSCQKFWERISATYRQAYCYSDFWEAYFLVIPSEQHVAAGKETGVTAHVERWNNTLRQRFGGSSRKSLSFSKSEKMSLK